MNDSPSIAVRLDRTKVGPISARAVQLFSPFGMQMSTTRSFAVANGELEKRGKKNRRRGKWEVGGGGSKLFYVTKYIF